MNCNPAFRSAKADCLSESRVSGSFFLDRLCRILSSATGRARQRRGLQIRSVLGVDARIPGLSGGLNNRFWGNMQVRNGPVRTGMRFGGTGGAPRNF
ncbi:hypothetical protein PROAA_930008 [Candidatus Propionivibrio aalborgensis]|uniref:Uncharacterized protein n=1 Tax=Candidatus Propionivibrio aalborgensis TaxID=1860101 RepID=A0A1A8Y2I8_9RHOO|nr:hypothetical protein PROAA_930008 [Candidatus Propionivibrio aalborgensis]